MSSFIEDRRPFAAAMQNYQRMDVDASTSQASLNIPEDNGKKYRAEQPGFLGINLRLLCSVISIIFFILTLLLFIATIVAYYNRPNSEVLQGANNTTSTSAGFSSKDVYSGDNQTSPNKDKDGSKSSTVPPELPDTKFETEKWSVTTINGTRFKPGALAFAEEFNTFDTSKWFHLTGNSENHFYFNVNNRSNSFVEDGILHLKPTYSEDRFGKAYIENGTLLLGIIPSEKCKDGTGLCWKGSGPIVHPIMAPLLTSKNFFKFKYGKLQIRAKMPSGDWIEPIISLQPDTSFYGDELKSGQIHFVDTKGNRKLFNADGVNVGSEQTCPDIRFGANDIRKLIYYCVSTDEDQGFDRDFHLYELEWTRDTITLKIDDEGIIAAPFPRPSMYKLWSKGRRIPNPWDSGAENPKLAPFDRDVSKLISFVKKDFDPT
ncbi:unnamed protein product [Orchesella dallaii]|uniref:GH16 domain-containing protein n=1 Tax=Orchesella dallaii TaxID=48710 RepID=A0ABP1RC66_9HEXA